MGQLVLESFVSFVIYVLDVGYILLSFSLRVIVNLEWPVRSQERWISLMMVLSWYLFSVQSIANEITNRRSVGWRKIGLRLEEVAFGGIVSGLHQSWRCMTASVRLDWVALELAVTVFDHLLETLGMSTMVNQRFEVHPWLLHILYTQLTSLIIRLMVVSPGKISNFLSLRLQVNFRNFRHLWTSWESFLDVIFVGVIGCSLIEKAALLTLRSGVEHTPFILSTICIWATTISYEVCLFPKFNIWWLWLHFLFSIVVSSCGRFEIRTWWENFWVV